MKNQKRNLITIAYSLMLILFLNENSHSVFVFLFAILTEFAILIILFITTQILYQEKTRFNYVNIIIGSIPIFIFNYFITYLAYTTFDEVNVVHLADHGGWLAPILIYKYQLMIISAFILLGYLMDLVLIRKASLEQIGMDVNLIKHAILLWVLGIVTFTVLYFIPSTFMTIGIAFLPIIRVAMELTVLKKKRLEEMFTKKLD